ncbi:uncharacterized protein EAF01_005853 [Botrytis porri]|uniref:Uncharacterized protein n=1 Tax=Botrytis porri TaxID=87229 RepID=A0A4Z1L4S9_9HELO|nr:uncharacterized protein EAF01_005853 [Botrytis porri]KAF7905332.1 hypothetical protein EAF01_005853 [Botrytis porri]TGO91841.1 hypothetical protein BPOR_0017g00230 [Botrytis porri]
MSPNFRLVLVLLGFLINEAALSGEFYADAPDMSAFFDANSHIMSCISAGLKPLWRGKPEEDTDMKSWYSGMK